MINPHEIISKYYPNKTDIYYILTIHSEQVAEKALAIAKLHPELRLDTEFLWEAAMLHDIGIFRCNAPRIHCAGTHSYIEHGFLGAELLRNEGLPEHAKVCERHTGTGLTREMILVNKIPIPMGNYEPQTLEEQVICYADKFFSKTKLTEMHTVDKIRNDLSKFGDLQVMKFDNWHKIFG
jgi:uncharacterized protein